MRRLFEYDLRLSERLRIAEQPGLIRNLAIILAHSGDSWFLLIGLAVVWLFGSPFWKGRAQEFALGIVVTAILVMVIKFSIRRRRPEGEWGGIYRATDPHSFPSGHAVRAMMMVVLGWGGGPVWLGGVLSLWAPLVGLARVGMGVHYLSDVLAGYLFGLMIGFLLLRIL